jgi:hypothetical protein
MGVLKDLFNEFSGANGQTAYIAKDLGENPLSIPDSVARAPNTQIKIEGDVVVITPAVINTMAENLSETDQLNSLSAISSAAGAKGILDQTNALELMLHNNITESMGLNYNAVDGNIAEDNGSGFVYVTPDLGDTTVPDDLQQEFGGETNNVLFQEISGVDYKNLNISQDYSDAFQTFLLAHEISHLSDDVNTESIPYDYQHMRTEIYADNHALNTYFNDNYKQFVFDLRAMNSLNNTGPSGEDESYAMHIWSEEFAEGRALTDAEAYDIAKAPKRLNERLKDELADRGLSEITDPAERYAAYKLMREQGAFDDIPYGNEYVDKYLAANERLMKPEILQPALTKISTDFAKTETPNIETETFDPLENYDPIEAEGNSPAPTNSAPTPAATSPTPNQVRPTSPTVSLGM